MIRAAVLCLLIAGCGGSDESDDPAAVYRAQAMEQAQTTCEPNGGLQVVLNEYHSHSRSGALLDVGLECRCHNGMTFRTPMRYE